MRILVDATEPGQIYQRLRWRIQEAGEPVEVERTWLHKRAGRAAAQRERTPHYASGADYLILDKFDIPLVSIERKTLHDLAKSASLDRAKDKQPRIFRQAQDLAASPLPILLLEGRPTGLYQSLEPMLLGLQFWLIRQGVSMLYTTTPERTADALFLMTRKLYAELHDELHAEPHASSQPDV